MDYRGRHIRSTPHIPLATPEADQENIFRKGKALGEGASTAEPGISDSSCLPLLETPLSASQFPRRNFYEVSHFLNFGSVPADISSPGLGLEGETLVTPISPDIVARSRPRNS
jgi:hypothetical protein